MNSEFDFAFAAENENGNTFQLRQVMRLTGLRPSETTEEVICKDIFWKDCIEDFIKDCIEDFIKDCIEEFIESPAHYFTDGEKA